MVHLPNGIEWKDLKIDMEWSPEYIFKLEIPHAKEYYLWYATYNVKEGEIRLCACNASHYKKKHKNTVKINQKLMILIIYKG